MKTVLKVMLGIILGCVVLIGGCAALFSSAVDDVQNESDRTAISVPEYGSAKVGTSTRKQLEARFGEPQTSNEVQAEGVAGIPESDFEQSCIYYARRGELASLFQFCFDGNGRLTSKASY